MSEPLYACVRFIDDKYKNYCIPIADIYNNKSDPVNIKPTSSTSFDPNHLYYIYWRVCDNNCDKEDKCCSLYKGYILGLGVTEEEAEQKAIEKKKRLIYHNQKASSSDTSVNNVTAIDNKKTQESKKKIKIVKKEVLEGKSRIVLNKVNQNFTLKPFGDSDNETDNTESHSNEKIQPIVKEFPKTDLKKLKIDNDINKEPNIAGTSKCKTQANDYETSENDDDSSLFDSPSESPPGFLRPKSTSIFGCPGVSKMVQLLQKDNSDDEEIRPPEQLEVSRKRKVYNTNDNHSPEHRSKSNYRDHFLNEVNEINNESENESVDKRAETEIEHEIQPVSAEEECNRNAEQVKNPKIKKRSTYTTQQFLLRCVNYYKKSIEGHGHEELEKRYKMCENDKLYLGEDIYIDSFQWGLIERNKPSAFINEVALILWTEKELMNRAFDLTKHVENIPGRSPIKLIEEGKLRLLISLYYDYISRNKFISKEEKINNFYKVISVLRNKIHNLRRQNKGPTKKNKNLKYNYKK